MYAAEYSIITHMRYIFQFYSSRATEVAHSERNQVYSYIVIVIIIIAERLSARLMIAD